jgi:hypothetical protein
MIYRSIAILTIFASMFYLLLKTHTKNIDLYRYGDGILNNMEIVVSRYNENLDWLKNKPFNRHKITIYNKGPNSSFYKPPGSKIVNLENVGRCDHTYLYHIIENYDNLADNTVFLPGSSDLPCKMKKAKKQVEEVEKRNDTVLIGIRYPRNVEDEFGDFWMDKYVSEVKSNTKINSDPTMGLAKIRPFGKWYKNKFKHGTPYVSYKGILGLNKRHIVQHPKTYYEELIKELQTHSNPEAGHYFERSWCAIFHPLDGVVFVPEGAWQFQIDLKQMLSEYR